LEEVLSELQEGTWVSLWIFGHYADGGSNKKGPIRQLRQMKKSTKAELKNHMREIRDQIIPYFGTPLVKTISWAQNDFDALPKDFKGFKTILVLTDGRDEEFVDTGGLEGIRNIPQFMAKKFKDSGISINMCFFQLTPSDEEEAKESFKGIENGNWRAPGKLYYIEKDPKELIKALRKSLKQELRYSVEEDDDSRVLDTPPEGFGVSRTAADDQWAKGLPPRDYFVRVQTNELNKRRISLDRGDLLLLQLSKTSLGIDFKRLLYAEADHPFKPSKKIQGWRLAVLQNQKRGERGLGMFVALEHEAQRDAPTLRQAKPTAVWIEIRPPAEVKESFGVRWKTEFGYPGPSWSFDVAQWPFGPEGQTKDLAPPTVHAWWSDELVPESASLKGSSFNNQIVRLKGDQIVVESLEFEDHRVETRPGQYSVQHCLVVRLGQVKDKPYWVKLNGIKPAPGEEHRFYKEAGKYTGLFWPVTKDQAAEELTGLSLFSLRDFKQEAERRKLSLEMPLPEPKANDDRPRPRFLLSDEK
jgi:hypothetical protein